MFIFDVIHDGGNAASAAMLDSRELEMLAWARRGLTVNPAGRCSGKDIRKRKG
jgi:hypothetical protein